MSLHWPLETALTDKKIEHWCQADSNRVLDFHGDPLKAELVVFSDGNHHMALQESLQAFIHDNPQAADIFYATTPPYPIIKLLESGAIRLGNLTLSIRPHVFISPPNVLEGLKAKGYLFRHHLLAQNRGSVLLIPRENPARIGSVGDLMHRDVRLFISNPDTEKVSYTGYRDTLEKMAQKEGLDINAFQSAVFGETTVYGERIHHREAPEAVAAGNADAAIVYYHLALRYTRIFPELFEIIPLGGTKTDPKPWPGNQIAKIHMGLTGDGGSWGQAFVEFMQSEAAANIYSHHGLQHVRNLLDESD